MKKLLYENVHDIVLDELFLNLPGFVPDGEEFSRTTFTAARRGEAERAYLAMRGSGC